MTTKLLYLEDFNLLDFEASVVEVSKEKERDIVVLGQTAFYPQGGGQPYDNGIVESPSGKFVVEEVRFLDGTVKHIGKFEFGSFKDGEKVRGMVDKERRKLHTRLHSAGHIVDMAVTELGFNWNPGKGYHFPDGPYVEYSGEFDAAEKEKIRENIETHCNKFVSEDRETKLLFMPKEEMKSVCHFVPDYLPEGKPARVIMYADFGVPCGGTHVNRLSEVGKIMIRKVDTKKGSIRVAYDIEK